MSEYILKKDITSSHYNSSYIPTRYGPIIPHLNKLNHVARSHAFGMLYGLIVADLCDIKEVYAIEFGVYNGEQLNIMCNLAHDYVQISDIKINIVGFDTFSGLPSIFPVVDHPEMWDKGEYYSMDKNEILKNCKSIYPHVELVDGDVKDTIQTFSLKKDCPISFISVDLDLYTSTKNALPILGNDREFYLPCVPMYFDDVTRVLTYNPYCGEQLAITEFNAEHDKRKIVKRQDTSLYNFYTCHILDHPVLTGEKEAKGKFNIFLEW
jgi:hypothetical protein